MVFMAHGDGETSYREGCGLPGGTQVYGSLQQWPEIRTSVTDFGESPDFLEQFQQLKFLSHK